MKKKKIIALGSIALSTIMIFNGCSSDANVKNEETFIYTDEDLNNFVTYEDLEIFKWYAIETFDGEKSEIKITKKTTSERKNSYANEYYYTDVLKEDYKVYRVIYNHEDEIFWAVTGPEIKRAVPLTYYLDKYGLKKASYSKEEIQNILEMIKKELTKKEKSLN